MHSKVLSAGMMGIETYPVEVQVEVAKGTEKFEIVGLPESCVKEGRSRIDSAIRASGYMFRKNMKIRVNLSPATVRKIGSLYDLPIAIGILISRGVVRSDLNGRFMIAGELSLDGQVKPIGGSLLLATKVKELGIEGLVIPKDNVGEVLGIEGISVYGVANLYETIALLNGERSVEKIVTNGEEKSSPDEYLDLDFKDVRGQESVKRAVGVAVSGSHNILMVGPPGSGKSMIAKRIPTILPEMSYSERLETTRIYSSVGLLPRGKGLLRRRPFRSPHHTISDAGMVGGNRIPRPGEMSLANNGVLFLDEFSEFKKHVLEVMRQPLEDGYVVISRALGSFRFPSKVILVGAMNPCPCGFLGDKQKMCECTNSELAKHLGKISNPLFDRIDIHVEVPRVDFQNLASKREGSSSKDMKERVVRAIKTQFLRFKGSGVIFNSQMTEGMMQKYCVLNQEKLALLESSMKKFSLSARAYSKIVKVARTIADLEGSQDIQVCHLAEAIHYRVMDRRQLF